MNQINLTINLIINFFSNYIVITNNQLHTFNSLCPESLKNDLIKILSYLNIEFKELNSDLIQVSFINNDHFLVPISIQGLYIIKNIFLLYGFQYFFSNVGDPYTGNFESIPVILKIPNLSKKYPITHKELDIFFNSIKNITDFHFIGNINLDDIFYTATNNYYIILNLKYLEYKNPYIETRLDNLLNDEKYIYYFNNHPLNIDDFHFLKNNGII